jgi:2-aminoadipate transaminase
VEDTRPLKADDVEDRVLYLSSFSKTVAPGFRVAWVTGAEPLIARMEIAKQSADLCTGGLDQRFVYEMWRRGTLESRLPRLREVYQTKRRVMEDALHHALGDLVSWPEPKGGFFLWASLPGLDTDALFARSLQHKVVYVPGSAFFADHSGVDRLRLAFSASSHEQIRKGISRLAAAVREERGAIESEPAAAGPDSAEGRPEKSSARSHG